MPYPWKKVPCEFPADWPTFIFRGGLDKGPRSPHLLRMVGRQRPAALDVIWHICSGQHCFKGVAGVDLPSSGDATLTMAEVPSEFQVDRPTFVFQ